MISELKHVAILGLGLIGGSIGAAIKRSGFSAEVVGYAPHHGPQALQLGLIDRYVLSALEAVEGADLVIIATPPSLVIATIEAIAPNLKKTAVLTDVASTKHSIVQGVFSMLEQQGHREFIGRFVPGHPIAGAETNGPVAANPNLFQGANVILTPTDQTQVTALALVQGLWAALGAKTQIMSASEHDRCYALVSHLPHFAAFALAHSLATQNDADQLLKAAGSGLRDTTRIAASAPELWVDIFEQNKPALLAAIDSFEQSLGAMKATLHSGSYAQLANQLKLASDWRRLE